MTALRTAGVGVRRRRPLPPLSAARLRPAAPELLLAALVLGFIALSAWWLGLDERVPDFDNAKHITIALGYFDAVSEGHPLVPFTAWHEYPPLVHLVGVAAFALGGVKVATAVIGENLLFVPLLVAGCYGVGRRAFDRRTGLLAAAFALGTPMVMALFHVFMLDGPEAALVAVCVWALLASDRFERVGISALAGVAAAAGLYTKGTFAVFVAGVVVTMLVRGGWRNWRGVAVFAAVAAALAAPWYGIHFSDLSAQTNGAVAGQRPIWYGSVPYPARWTVSNYTWYAWNFVNNQVYLPLALFFVTGTALAVRRWVGLRLRGRRDPQARELAARSYIPELLVGAGTSYLAISYLVLDDPRYTLPMLVYVAALATGWLSWLGRRRRAAATAGLAAILALNVFMLNSGDLGDATIRLPNAVHNPIGEWTLTVASDKGYVEGAPDRHGLRDYFESFLRRARRDGARTVIFEPRSLNSAPFNLPGVGLMARAADVRVLEPWQAPKLGPRDAYVYRSRISASRGKPCLPLGDGTSLYLIRGVPEPGSRPSCPPGPAPQGPP